MEFIGRIAAVMAFSLVALSLPATGEDKTAPLRLESDRLVLEALGHQLSMPLPLWMDKGQEDVLGRLSTRYEENPSDLRLEIFPEGESPLYWTQLYGAQIVVDGQETLSDYRDAVMNVYARGCQPRLTGFFQLSQDQGEILAPLGFICGGYYEGLPGYSGSGEVMVMSFKRSGDGVALTYHEWRGKAFDPRDTTSWPVAPQTVEAQMRSLQDEVSLAAAD